MHGGAPAPAARVDLAPPMWHVPIGACLGAGGFASVWELAPDRVLKIAHASHDLARARIAREAEALAAIGAPAVPRVHASGVSSDGRGWIEMERIAGATLGELVAVGPIRAHDALALAGSVLDALERVHAAHLVHRDLKPDNLVARGGGVTILDLGLARKLPIDRDDPTRATTQVGSLEYMPPEQLADSAAVDERSDLYAFGCVAYELLAGRPPFLGDAVALERAHTALRPPRLGALVQVSAAVEAVILDCLAKQPARRPASAAEVRARLAAAVDERSPVRSASVSMLREGKQPVVLLWTELPRVDRALLGLVLARRLVIVSQRGRRVLAAVLGGDHADPASVAIAAARDLAAHGARVALHLDALRVETAGGAAIPRGASVDHPESWLPGRPWTGVIATRALAAVAQVATRDSALGDGLRELAEDRAAAELVGRDALLTDLAADAAAAITPARGPAFALLVGDAGVGKTAVAAALARRLDELGVRVCRIDVPAPGTGRPAQLALAEQLGARLEDAAIVRGLGDALRAAARAQPLAVIVDDLHHADHELLDALEYATLGGEALPLWVLGVASPRLEARRPQLGARAERHRADVLAPLDEDAAVALAAELLRPAEYPPLRALRQLAALAHGNPLHLAALARQIHERGAIRARDGGGMFLDTSALDELEPAALGPWLAARALRGLGAELVALARLCAVLGGELGRDELVAILDAVERRGGATTTIDVDVGLRELVRAGVLVASEHGHRFREPLVEDGVYATTDEAERLVLHQAALDHARAADDAARIARHAEAAGERRIAADAFARLGARALAAHHPLDADQAWSAALRQLDDRDPARGRALLGRGRARYRMQRMREALIDLEAAIACAADSGEVALEVEAMIEQATALDFCEDFERSREAAATARRRLGLAGEPALALELDLADARAVYRAGSPACIAPLRAVYAAARAAGRDETATIAGILLGPMLSEHGEPDEAERVFAEVIATCTERGDRFHLAAALGNRAFLWAARGEPARGEDDLRAVIQLARESGQAHLERVPTYNLAELRLWRGELDEALRLARRSLALQSRAGEGTTRPDRWLLARVLAARGEAAELGELIDALASDNPGEATQLAVLRAATGRAGWDAALARLTAERAGLAGFAVTLHLEQLALAHRAGALDRATRAAARHMAAGDAFWRHRLHDL
ncbi:MAG TPA: serine/threonine-protein kinase [Kofleriaceae bacterium]|nr:serine/threonine-protein kinase [Kofleriaceae bacterium]